MCCGVKQVVIAADEYYRKCISEPRGSRASWNARDQHMATTLLRIQASRSLFVVEMMEVWSGRSPIDRGLVDQTSWFN